MISLAITDEEAPVAAPATTRPEVNKPPYRVPSMAEIAELEPNGFTVASTFSGCGGSSLGYRIAGFRVLWASEFVDAARDTYRANAAPYTVLDGRDIRDVTPADVLAGAGVGVGELDLLDGSPPCASFSTAGSRHKAWGQVKKYSEREQRTDDLFFEYARLIDGVQPRVFIAENVSGLVKGSAKGYFKEILAALQACGPGYQVSARVLDAAWLGVPQARQRLIFVGVRRDLELPPVHPSPLPYRYTVRDALPWITGQMRGAGYGEGGMAPPDQPSQTIGASPSTGNGLFPPSQVESRVIHDTSGLYGAGDVTDRPSPTISVGVNSVNSRHFQVHEPASRVVHDTGGSFDQGGDVTDKPAPVVTANSGGSMTGRFRVETPIIARKGRGEPGPVDVDRPAPTVMAYGIGDGDVNQTVLAGGPAYDEHGQPHDPETGHKIGLEGYLVTRQWDAAHGRHHDVVRRRFTLGELRAICGFPADFVLTGTYAQRWERLGRAVPPVMMSHIAATVRDRILIPARDAGRI